MAKYSKAFKEEAIRLSDKVGSRKAAAQLGAAVLHARRLAEP